MPLEKDLVWLITGCSTGFGRLIAEEALARGHRVVATARNADSLRPLVERHGDRVLALPLDVTDKTQIEHVLCQAELRLGGIDLLVNNAGHGYVAAVEEGEEDQIRGLFEVNFFGLAALTRAALPRLRRKGRGWIVNLSSIAGIAPNAGAGYYAASKFAVEGLSDALAMEVAPFGIRVLLVEPGPFRTEFGTRSMHASPAIAAYADTPAGERRRRLSDPHAGSGEPEEVVRRIFAALSSPNPPLRLVIGDTAVKRATAKLTTTLREIGEWQG